MIGGVVVGCGSDVNEDDQTKNNDPTDDKVRRHVEPMRDEVDGRNANHCGNNRRHGAAQRSLAMSQSALMLFGAN